MKEFKIGKLKVLCSKRKAEDLRVIYINNFTDDNCLFELYLKCKNIKYKRVGKIYLDTATIWRIFKI